MNDSAPAAGHKVIVVGGGIGGLTLALCLHRAGFRPQVLERAPALGEIGAGIQLSPNACRVLAALDLLETVRATAFAPEHLEMRVGTSGRPVFAIAAGAGAEQRWGAPYLHVHRADLIEVLGQALAARVPDALTTAASVSSLQQLADGVRVRLDDDRAFEGALLVGADGIHSTIRAAIFGPDAARFTGNVAWRATVPVERLGSHAPPPSACVWVGAGRHAVTYRLRGGTLANLVGVVEQRDWHDESWTARGDSSQALADFAGWHPVITTLLTEAGEHYRWALCDRPPLPRWHQARVTLIGDACHAMLPFLAQGAAMAIEDAWVLAAMLARHPHDEALRQYTAARLPRVQRVYDGARRNQRTFHHTSPLMQTLAWGTLRLGGRWLPGVAQSRLDWLYGEDVTQRYPLRGRDQPPLKADRD